MFDGYCPACNITSLYGPQRIVALQNERGRIVLTFRCWCGTLATRIFGERPPSGRHAQPVAKAG